MARVGDDGINCQSTIISFAIVQNWDDKGLLAETIDDFTEHIRAFVAIKQGADSLNL